MELKEAISKLMVANFKKDIYDYCEKEYSNEIIEITNLICDSAKNGKVFCEYFTGNEDMANALMYYFEEFNIYCYKEGKQYLIFNLCAKVN